MKVFIIRGMLETSGNIWRPTDQLGTAKVIITKNMGIDGHFKQIKKNDNSRVCFSPISAEKMTSENHRRSPLTGKLSLNDTYFFEKWWTLVKISSKLAHWFKSYAVFEISVNYRMSLDPVWKLIPMRSDHTMRYPWVWGILMSDRKMKKGRYNLIEFQKTVLVT